MYLVELTFTNINSDIASKGKRFCVDDLKVSVCAMDEVAVAAERAVLANIDLIGLAKVNLGTLKLSIQTTVFSSADI